MLCLELMNLINYHQDINFFLHFFIFLNTCFVSGIFVSKSPLFKESSNFDSLFAESVSTVRFTMYL